MSKKHALIVGASSGLGYECVKRFSKKYNVTGISRRGSVPDGLDLSSVQGLSCDATNPDDLRASMQEAIDNFGKFSLIIVSSGHQNIKPVRAFKLHESLDLVSVNFLIPFNVSTLFASHKFSMPDAILCFVSSIAAIRPESGIVLYGATKAAVESMVAGLAKELAPRRVVGVSPGWLDTPMTRNYSHIYNEEFLNNMKNRSPLGVVDVSDVVEAIDFLTSESAAKITGQVLVIDGGISL
jgi:NAD(P)-dependent dehydrogenase (short-subunit alcohol dehydrogenase family)